MRCELYFIKLTVLGYFDEHVMHFPECWLMDILTCEDENNFLVSLFNNALVWPWFKKPNTQMRVGNKIKYLLGGKNK